jgi:hypothetical protein
MTIEITKGRREEHGKKLRRLWRIGCRTKVAR